MARPERGPDSAAMDGAANDCRYRAGLVGRRTLGAEAIV